MKNKAIVLTFAILLTFVVGVWANTLLSSTEIIGTENISTEKYLKLEEVDNKLKTCIKEDKVIELLMKQNLGEDEVQLCINDYAELLVMLNPSDSEVKKIKEFVGKGYDLRKICEIYRFMLDIDIDMDMLEKVYKEAENQGFEGKYWKEKAYSNVSGIHNSDVVVIDYVNKGITLGEIEIAQKLSWRGKMSMKEILDGLVSGTSWIDIYSDVYGEMNIKKDLFKNETDGNVIFNYIQVSRALGKDVNEIYSKSEGDPIKFYSSELHPKFVKMKKFLKDNNLKYDYKNSEVQKNKQELINSGISEKKLKELVFKGYSVKEMKRAADVSKGNSKEIESVLEKYKLENTWEVNR